LLRADKNGIRGTKEGLYLGDGRFSLCQVVFHAFATPFSTKIANEEQGQKDDSNHQEDFFLDEVQKMHDEGDDRRHDSGNGIPIEA
jgi:hypothetical protein